MLEDFEGYTGVNPPPGFLNYCDRATTRALCRDDDHKAWCKWGHDSHCRIRDEPGPSIANNRKNGAWLVNRGHNPNYENPIGMADYQDDEENINDNDLITFIMPNGHNQTYVRDEIVHFWSDPMSVMVEWQNNNARPKTTSEYFYRFPHDNTLVDCGGRTAALGPHRFVRLFYGGTINAGNPGDATFEGMTHGQTTAIYRSRLPCPQRDYVYQTDALDWSRRLNPEFEDAIEGVDNDELDLDPAAADFDLGSEFDSDSDSEYEHPIKHEIPQFRVANPVEFINLAQDFNDTPLPSHVTIIVDNKWLIPSGNHRINGLSEMVYWRRRPPHRMSGFGAGEEIDVNYKPGTAQAGIENRIDLIYSILHHWKHNTTFGWLGIIRDLGPDVRLYINEDYTLTDREHNRIIWPVSNVLRLINSPFNAVFRYRRGPIAYTMTMSMGGNQVLMSTIKVKTQAATYSHDDMIYESDRDTWERIGDIFTQQAPEDMPPDVVDGLEQLRKVFEYIEQRRPEGVDPARPYVLNHARPTIESDKILLNSLVDHLRDTQSHVEVTNINATTLDHDN